VSGFPLFGPASATVETVLAGIPSIAHERFTAEMVPALWAAASRYRLDPVGLIAQAGRETNWGIYDGQVDAEAHNTCGLKLSPAQQRLYAETGGDKPLAHSMWTNFYAGAVAHAQHVWAWADMALIDLPDLLIDPRWAAVKSLIPERVKAVTWGDLGGRWTTSLTYGTENESIMVRLGAVRPS
jgi:hypothetical protein